MFAKQSLKSQTIEKSPRTFGENIQQQSTPLRSSQVSKVNVVKPSNRNEPYRYNLFHNFSKVIDLTPKRRDSNKSEFYDSSESDVEIIENTPIIITLDDEDEPVDNSVKFIIASSSPLKESNISADIHVSTENVNIMSDDYEILNKIEQPINNVCSEETPMYVNDKTGGTSIQPPLYDIISDDSFNFDSTTSTPQGSQNTYTNISDNTLVNISDDTVKCFGSSSRSINDDSVIIVSASFPHQRRSLNGRSLDFISIRDKTRKNGQKQNRKIRRKRGQSKQKLPETTHTHSVTHVYNPNVERPIRGTKRLIIIDGSNVAYRHTSNQTFSVEGIAICIEYFTKLGHDVKAILPEMRLKLKNSSNQDLLRKLEAEQKLVFTPCKRLPGKNLTSYDDRFILDYAIATDAIVISNDNFRDLMKEREEYRKIISTRIVGFTFMNDIIAFPQDPYGKQGPSLDDLLNRREI